MSFKSESHRKKCEQLVKEGKMSQETFDKWAASTTQKLPQKALTQPKGQVRGVRRVR